MPEGEGAFGGPKGPEAEGRRLPRGKAVALRYWPGLPAPFIAAKASGRSAERLLAIAEEAEVPVFKDGVLADLLYPLELGAWIPDDYYEIVARVFAFVKAIEEA